MMFLRRLSKTVRYGELENHTMARAEDHLKKILPNGRVQGREYVSLNPLRHDNKLGSFKYNLQKHVWADFATGKTGRGIVSLYAYLHGLSYGCAAKEIEKGVFTPITCGQPKAAKVSKVEMLEKTTALVKTLWKKTRSADGTLVSKYLRARGLRGAIPPALRYLPDAWHVETRKNWPAMVACVSIWPSREIIGIHRTYLSPDGTKKAEIEPNKKMLGSCCGGAVRFGLFSDKLIVAEGIETALSLYQATDLPTWAALSTSGMVALKLPALPFASDLLIGADNDPAGIKAAETAAWRWIEEGRKVRIAYPEQGKDFNDLLRCA